MQSTRILTADPDHPVRDPVLRAGTLTYGMLVERDCAELLAWLVSGPGRCLTVDSLAEYARAHEWTRGYLRGIVERVRVTLRSQSPETVDQVRTRLAVQSSEIRDEARDAGDFAPAVAATRLEADLLIPKQTKTTVTSVSIVARLEQAEKRAGLVQRTRTVETVTTETSGEPEQPVPFGVGLGVGVLPPAPVPWPEPEQAEPERVDTGPCDPGES
jgi:hypothetical protein